MSSILSQASTQIVVIAALAKRRVIGLKGQMPWHLPPDLKHFKATTMGCRMVMGRTTLDGFGGRLLPGREHLVLSKHTRTSTNEALRYVHTLDEALDFSVCPPILPSTQIKQIFVIGGAQIYQLALAHPRVNKAILTHIHLDCEGDAFFPELGPEWRVTEQSPSQHFEDISYHFSTYER